MSKTIYQTYADLGVAADANYMISYDIQSSLSMICLTGYHWYVVGGKNIDPLKVTHVAVKLKGNAKIVWFGPAAGTGLYDATSPFDNTLSNDDIHTYLDSFFTDVKITDTEALVDSNKTAFLALTGTEASPVADLTVLKKFIGFVPDTNSADNFIIFAQGSATTTSGVNAMVESITLKIEGVDDDATISTSTFTPLTNFSSTARLGAEIELTIPA